MELLLFGFSHHARMAVQAKPHRFRGVSRNSVRRLAWLRAILPLPEASRKIGREAFPKLPPRQAWAIAQILWRGIERTDAVAVWNGSRDFALAATRIAHILNKPLVFVESGLLPGTYQIDPKGINFASSLGELTPETLRAMVLPDSACETAIAFRQRPLGRDTGHAAVIGSDFDLPQGFVLFAAQVHDDSQIQRFSPDFTSVEAAIRYVAVECAALGVPLVVKEHPSDHGRIDYSALRASLPDVRFLAEADNAALIEACRAFVTVNSSLGLQAVHAGKPTFTLGDAAYNLPGVATRIRPPDRLRDALQRPDIDADLRRKYFAYLTGSSLVACKSRIPDDAELRDVIDRMISVLKAQGKTER